MVLFFDKLENEIENYMEEIEKYLNNNLYKYELGKSINEIYFSYDIFDFDDTKYKQYIDSDKKYKYGKNKDLSIMEQFDSNLLDGKSKKEKIELLCTGMLKAISKVEMMVKKPKDFNTIDFQRIFDKLMVKYVEKIL